MSRVLRRSQLRPKPRVSDDELLRKAAVAAKRWRAHLEREQQAEAGGRAAARRRQP